MVYVCLAFQMRTTVLGAQESESVCTEQSLCAEYDVPGTMERDDRYF